MEIPHDFFLITPKNSASFLIGTWNFHALFFQYPGNSIFSISRLDFSGIAHKQLALEA